MYKVVLQSARGASPRSTLVRISTNTGDIMNRNVPPLAFAALLAPALASALTAEPAPLTEIVVTGLRQSIQTSQEINQNEEVIVDSISAVDISALPDRSVTEALQRISGVAIDHLFGPSDTNRLRTRIGSNSSRKATSSSTTTDSYGLLEGSGSQVRS